MGEERSPGVYGWEGEETGWLKSLSLPTHIQKKPHRAHVCSKHARASVPANTLTRTHARAHKTGRGTYSCFQTWCVNDSLLPIRSDQTAGYLWGVPRVGVCHEWARSRESAGL